MATTVGELIHQHSTNPTIDTLLQSESNKAWVKSYHPISRLLVHTRWQGADFDDGNVTGDFTNAFLEEYDDEALRLNEPAYPPNCRQWRLDSEEDGAQWFNTEVSNIVLPAFTKFPLILQCYQEKALSEKKTDETVDTQYSVLYNNRRLPIAIGEFKRGILKEEEWRSGRLSKASQRTFSQELRGYAHKYRCPQVFCFDNYTFLMLQFRARTPDEIKDPKCEVDCWIFPRENFLGTPLRYALYRLLLQGFCRCQGMIACDVALYGQRPSVREFYNGRPLWKLEDGKLYARPWGHERVHDSTCGAFYWSGPDGSTALLDGNNNRVWDTMAFWVLQEAEEPMAEEEEDLYGPG